MEDRVKDNTDISIDLDLWAKSNPRQTIRQHTDDLLVCCETLNLLYGLEPHIYNLLKDACEYHDYGKVNEIFQDRINDTHMKFNVNDEVPHNLLSAYFLDSDRYEKKDYGILCYSIINHHYNSNNDLADYFREEKKRNILEQNIRKYIGEKDLGSVFANANQFATDKDTILVKGLLHRCDYAASADINVEIPNDFLLESLDEKVKEWDIPEFNVMQQFCQNNSDNNIIVTASTGMGKTEGALLWMGDNKGMYILPLRSAINSIYLRLKEMVDKEKASERIALLHSDNTGFIIRENINNNMDLYEYKSTTKQFALPITISTPDQLFDFVFRAPGYELKLATAAFSKVVIDEIQAYDATLLAYIIYGIHQIMDMGGKVAIITATLPGFVREHLIREGRDIRGRKGQEYNFQTESFSIDSVRHNIETIDNEISSEFIAEKCRNNKVLVICNTVKKAQRIYAELKDMNMSGVEVRILHAKFIRQERSNLEHDIFIDGDTDNKKSIIWVTTQVVEASLDIDFDCLITELSDLNGLFQRMGRCNRKGKKSADETNCYVFTTIDDFIITNDKNNKGFIDRTIYELSLEALKEIHGKISEDDKARIIEETFSSEKMKNSKYERIYKETYDYLRGIMPMSLDTDYVQQKFRNIVAATVIPEEIYNQNVDLINESLAIMHKSGKDYNVDERKKLWEEKQIAKNNIMNLTVDVSYRDIFPKNKIVIETIKVDRYTEIYVMKANYDEKGYYRYSKEQLDELNVSNHEEDTSSFL